MQLRDSASFRLAENRCHMLWFYGMSTITEIEAAIEHLPEPQVAELAAWLEKRRAWRATPPAVDTWLARARGAARAGVTTDQVMSSTRGEE